MKYNIAIIGAGQLGSRHLQGVINSNLDLLIQVVDPSRGSLNVAEQRANEMLGDASGQVELQYLTNIDELESDIDLVIVATNADIRFVVMKELLEKKSIRNLVLEKVLFQKKEDYDDARVILSRVKTRCWVNHPRRCYPFYHEIKEKLAGSTAYDISVFGGDWGLACNGLHFLDLISYLTSSSVTSLSTDYLSSQVKDSKRAGFVELNGTLSGQLKNGVFSVTSIEQKSPISLSISTDKIKIDVCEALGDYFVYDYENKQVVRDNQSITMFQSQLTSELGVDILESGATELPEYNAVSSLHELFATELQTFINRNTSSNYNYCPIT